MVIVLGSSTWTAPGFPVASEGGALGLRQGLELGVGIGGL